MFKKLLTSFLLSLTILFSFAPYLQIKAQTWYNQSFPEWYTKVYDESVSPSNEIFGERYTAAQVQWVVWSLVALPLNFIGKDNQEAVNCFLKYIGDQQQDVVECAKGAAGSIENIFKLLIPNLLADNQDQSPLSLMFNTDERSFSGIRYTKDILAKISLVKKVNAQEGGFGYNTLGALQKYWRGFRNMAYFLLVVVAIVFSFMIMFRVKISPQVVISIQSALPKIIVAAILATFSYAIAGFLVDLTYVVGGLFASLMNMAGFATSFREAFDVIVPIEGSAKLGNFYILGWMFVYTIGFFISAIVSAAVTLSQLSIWGFLASIVVLIFTVWVFILMIVYAIKVPWVLLKTLISIFISIVVAPVQIVLGALIPSLSFGQWFKKLIADLLVFPVTGLLLFLASSTLWTSIAVNFRIIGHDITINGVPLSQEPGKLWSPPIVGSAADMTGLLWLIASFGFIIMIPKAVDLLKSLIMGEKFAFGTAMGEAIGPLKFAYGKSGAEDLVNVISLARRSRMLEGQLAEGTFINRLARILIGGKNAKAVVGESKTAYQEKSGMASKI